MTKLESAYILSWAKKIKAIKLLGGKCKKCGETDKIILEFHHKNPKNKEFLISRIISYRWSKIKKEILKCDLLCRNCHFETHHIKYTYRDVKSKQVFLEFKKNNKCKKCGYDKDLSALHFHHKNPNEKDFKISSKRCMSLEFLSEELKKELNKCDVLCSNCHSKEHFDYLKFDIFKKEIYKKLNDYKELPKKYDRKEILKMYNYGMKQIEIAKKMNCSKGTISYILKKEKIC